MSEVQKYEKLSLWEFAEHDQTPQTVSQYIIRVVRVSCLSFSGVNANYLREE